MPQPFKTIILVLLFGLVCFGVPRGLEAILGEHQAWIPVLYQYLVGGVVFTLGIWLILAKGSCVPGRGDDRLWLGMLIIGFFVYLGMHLGWTALALAT